MALRGPQLQPHHPQLGRGRPGLAACPAWPDRLSAGGSWPVAVWERNLSTNLEAYHPPLLCPLPERHTGRAAAVDNAGVFTDILPQVAHQRCATGCLVRDSDTDLTDANSRRISLRFLNGSTVFTPARTAHRGHREVALKWTAQASPVLAFTQLENSQQLLSNRRPLWAAAVTRSGPTTCTWHPVK